MKEENFIYCDNLKCNNMECLRRYANAPWNEVIKVHRYFPDKEGKCKGELKEE